MKLAKFLLTPTIVAISVALCAALSSFGAFRYETTLTVDGYKEAATLENFPLLVRISSARISGFSYGLCQSDGKDIQFTSEDGKTIYPHEIDEWNTGDGEESLVWVRVPLAAGMKILMKFGDTSMEEPPAYSVNGSTWTGADFFSVYHFGETANIGTKNFRAADSTENGYEMKPAMKKNLTTCETMASLPGVVGRAVRTYDPDSTEETYLHGVNYNEQGVSDFFTLSGWVNILKYTSNAGGLYNRKDRDNYPNGWNINTISATQFSFYGSGDWSVRQNITVGSVVGTMIYVTVVVNGTTETLYVNGELKGSVTVPAPTNNDQAFHIGAVSYAWDQATPLVVDETRLRKGNSSEAWIAADYASQMDAAYVSATAVEEVVVEGNTITITATPEELPFEGITYGPDQKIVPGDVEFTASAEMQTQGEHHYRVLGWNLTVYGSDGSTTKSSDEGCTCVFTHKNGDTEKLEWVLGDMYGVTATSADETRGTVTGTGYYDAGSEATFTATPLAGFEFVKWVSADVPPEQVYSPEVTLTVTKAMSLQATFAGKRYEWKDPVTGNWSESKNWKNGEIPPNDGTADVVFPGGTAAYTITAPTGTTRVRSVLIKSPMGEANNKNIVIGGGTLSFGAGGLAFDDAAYSVGIQINSTVVIETSQSWLITSAKNQSSLYMRGAVKMDETDANGQPIVWTVAGKSAFYACFTGKDIKGKMRVNRNITSYDTNMPDLQISAPGVLELFDGEVPIAGTGDIAVTHYQDVTSNLVDKVVSPINFDMASKSVTFTMAPGTYVTDNAWRHRISSVFTGTITDRKLILTGANNLSHLPFKQQILLDGDMSALNIEGEDPGICLSHKVFFLKNNKAFGPDNSFSAYFGGASAGGYLTGLMTDDGVDYAGDVFVSKQNPHVIFGLLEPGTATYSGDFATTDGASGRAQIHLSAAKGATAKFTGSFSASGVKDAPLVAEGGGTVELDGDNVALNQQPVTVRAASLVLGHANAAGTKAIDLGGTVPSVWAVKYAIDNDFDYVGGWQYYGIKSTDDGHTYTITKNAPLTWGGMTLRSGDTFLNVPTGSGAGRMYTMTSDSTFEVIDVPYAVGMKVRITDGPEYAGKVFQFMNGTAYDADGKPSGWGGSLLMDEDNPDVKVLAKGGVTIANDINVTDNKSTGVSAIGSADASTVTFSGAITLAKDVFFEAAEGSTVNVTGTITDEGAHNVGLAGLGTVNFAQGLDIAGKAITVRLPVDGVPTEGSVKYVLATGLSGTPASVTVVTDDGSAVPSEWTARVVGSKLVFRNKSVGLQVIVK